MGDPGNHEFLIVSNLHMSAGHDPRTRAYDRNEDFFYDAAFSRFIDHYLARAGAHGRSFRLVILGDFVDFLQIELGQEAGATCSAPGPRRRQEIRRRLARPCLPRRFCSGGPHLTASPFSRLRGRLRGPHVWR